MIKFRAWDNLLNKMLVVYRISFDGPVDGVQVHCYLDDRGAEGSTEYAYDGDGLILEQFIGLTDVNGKDIYEGDIVHVITEDGYERTGEVIFEKGCYWADNGMDKYPVNRVSFKRDTLEVVGNVHVNPETIDFCNMKHLGDLTD